MATHALAQVSFGVNSALPRDRQVVTLSYRWQDFTIQDAESLANNILDAFEGKFTSLATTDHQCKIYDHEGTPPVLPMADVHRFPGVLHGVNIPNEIALCLSFDGGQHQPRQRGRIFLPAWLIGGALSLRPSDTQMNTILGFATDLSNVGGANVDWIVWSRVNRSATGINHAWVDDEWDTQRRRGLRATKRFESNL
jgi:hypothetical protein